MGNMLPLINVNAIPREQLKIRVIDRQRYHYQRQRCYYQFRTTILMHLLLWRMRALALPTPPLIIGPWYLMETLLTFFLALRPLIWALAPATPGLIIHFQ
ncbi:hypothetical protein AMTR_s00036p00185780 [Amborella trichopoda]|uniref:Uncharacterized protein n=1 Tax=Amborella trichopoda TaxID=13333 RepID=U5D1V4_AMBTC|nr:hypothetical protein AMTR_s00036p00185780 [Amborella trichopoda]